MKIWEKYFFFEALKTVLYFLAAIIFIYILVDYASHTGQFHHHHIRFNFSQFALYYTSQLLEKSDVLIPFALLVATIKVLCQLNVRNELVALLAAGTKMQRLLRPFIWLSLMGVFFLYLSEQFFVPWSKQLTQIRLGDQFLKLENPAAHHVVLEDKTLLIFQTYNKLEKRFYDVWWVPSINQLMRFKTLQLDPTFGFDVETFSRLASGAIVSEGKQAERFMPEIRFNQNRLLETLTHPEDLALSDLFKQLSKAPSTEKEARLASAFWMKLFLPWLALFAVLGAAPLCLIFTRNLNTLFIYAVSIFGLVFLYVLLNAASILAERQMVSPFWGLFIPFSLVASIVVYRVKLT